MRVMDRKETRDGGGEGSLEVSSSETPRPPCTLDYVATVSTDPGVVLLSLPLGLPVGEGGAGRGSHIANSLV